MDNVSEVSEDSLLWLELQLYDEYLLIIYKLINDL